MLLALTESQTIINQDGRILYFGLKDFISRIVNGNDCFICGATPTDVEFNKEHIIPNWILGRFNLHSKSITLPNGSSIKYGVYTVPCCKRCNSQLSEVYENPMSKLFSKSYSEICDTIAKDFETYTLLFKWLNLIFLKTHLKDRLLRKSLDHRKDEGNIGDTHYWEEMHHIHCIARSHYTNAKIDYKVFGSVFIFPSLRNGKEGTEDHFDYIDHEVGKGILLQLGQFTIIGILNDACGAYSCYMERFSKIKGPLTIFQSRQVFTDLLFLNINLKNRPVFRSSFSATKEYTIEASLPEQAELLEKQDQIVQASEMLSEYVAIILNPGAENGNQIIAEIREGKRNYLWDDKHEFIDFSKMDKVIENPLQ